MTFEGSVRGVVEYRAKVVKTTKYDCGCAIHDLETGYAVIEACEEDRDLLEDIDGSRLSEPVEDSRHG